MPVSSPPRASDPAVDVTAASLDRVDGDPPILRAGEETLDQRGCTFVRGSSSCSCRLRTLANVDHSRFESRSFAGSVAFENIEQADVERSEVPAVVARGHAEDRRASRRPRARRPPWPARQPRGSGRRSRSRRHIGRPAAARSAPRRGASGRTPCSCWHGGPCTCCRPWSPTARCRPGTGGSRPGTRGGSRRRPTRWPRASRPAPRPSDEVAAGDALDRAERLLAEELAVHHRDPPVPPAADLLGDLPAVAEVAEPAARRLIVFSPSGRPL